MSRKQELAKIAKEIKTIKAQMNKSARDFEVRGFLFEYDPDSFNWFLYDEDGEELGMIDDKYQYYGIDDEYAAGRGRNAKDAAEDLLIHLGL